MIRRVGSHIRDQWMGALALFLVLGGGTAFAVNEWTGDNIVNGSLASADYKNNDIRSIDVRDDSFANGGLTGADVDESALDATPLRTRVSKGGCEGNEAGDVMVKVGPLCVDRYEASIWDAPTGGNQITGAIPCNAAGQNCFGANAIYARSVAAVEPAEGLTYFQAQAALANSGKRLPTNAEWQSAAAGSPSPPGACNTTIAGGVGLTGAKRGCSSHFGANDMVGNLWEFVAEWVPRSTACPGWPGSFSNDSMCLAGASTSTGPGALIRGGAADSVNGQGSGAFAISGSVNPALANAYVGFRGVR